MIAPMPDTFELTAPQRTALANFIGIVTQDTGGPIFDDAQCSDLQLLVLALLAADLIEVENLGEFFLEKFGLAGINAESLADFLACTWAEKIDQDIRIAGGGPN